MATKSGTKSKRKPAPNYPATPEELAKAIFRDADRKLDKKLKQPKQR